MPLSNPYLSDPGYQAALQQQQIQGAADQQALQNLISQRLIAYGDPSLAGQYGADAAAISANTQAGNSELAQLQRAHGLAQQAIINRLAARGIINSGETGYQTGQENQNYGHNIYSAQQRLLSDILGYRQSELTQEQALRDNVAQALQQAWANYAQNPDLYGTGGSSEGQSLPSVPTYTPQQEANANAAINYFRGRFFGA